MEWGHPADFAFSTCVTPSPSLSRISIVHPTSTYGARQVMYPFAQASRDLSLNDDQVHLSHHFNSVFSGSYTVHHIMHVSY